VFCDQRLLSGAPEPVSAEDVRVTLREYEENDRGYKDSAVLSDSGEVDCQPPEIAFYGGSFTAIPVAAQNELLEAASFYLRREPRSKIRISTRPDCIDAKILERLFGYGVATVELGAQSMCDDVLTLSKRGHSADDVVRAARLVKEAGMSLILQMMTGLPGDTPEKSLYTARRFVDIGPDGVRIYPTVVVRGTRLHEMWKNGDYREHTIEEAVSLCADICRIFEYAEIPVIRLGLNPSQELTSGGAVAGAYHPSLGELVRSRMYFDKAALLLEAVRPGSDITLTVAKGSISKMTGNRRCNTDELKRRFSLRSLKVTEEDIKHGELIVSINGNAKKEPKL